jgi:hypothetical protein
VVSEVFKDASLMRVQVHCRPQASSDSAGSVDSVDKVDVSDIISSRDESANLTPDGPASDAVPAGTEATLESGDNDAETADKPVEVVLTAFVNYSTTITARPEKDNAENDDTELLKQAAAELLISERTRVWTISGVLSDGEDVEWIFTECDAFGPHLY